MIPTWPLFAVITLLAGRSAAQQIWTAECPPVGAPPNSFFEKVRETDRDVARQFYLKYLDVKGLPVVASAEVADLALQRTYYLVTHLLAGRPDILQAMIKKGTRLVIIGKDQV